MEFQLLDDHTIRYWGTGTYKKINFQKVLYIGGSTVPVDGGAWTIILFKKTIYLLIISGLSLSLFLFELFFNLLSRKSFKISWVPTILVVEVVPIIYISETQLLINPVTTSPVRLTETTESNSSFFLMRNLSVFFRGKF